LPYIDYEYRGISDAPKQPVNNELGFTPSFGTQHRHRDREINKEEL